jgi:hypothetical protein
MATASSLHLPVGQYGMKEEKKEAKEKNKEGEETPCERNAP